MNTNSTTHSLFGNDSALLLPTPIRDLLRIASAFNADPLAVVATGFSIAATAVGASHRITVPNAEPITPGFNLALVGAQDRELPWLYPVQQPIAARVNDVVIQWLPDKGKAIANAFEGRNRDYQAAVKCGQSPDLLKIAALEVYRHRAARKPFVIASGLDPKLLQGQKKLSFDSTITAFPTGSDLFESWLELKQRDRLELTRMLNMSCQGLPEPGPMLNLFGAGVPTRTAANALLGVPNPPPILFLSVAPVPRISTTIDTREWGDVLNRLFDIRCKELNEIVMVEPAAEIELARYGQEPGIVPWFPDLARRIAFLCGHLDNTPFNVETARRGIAITLLLAEAHKRAVATMCPLTPAQTASSKLEEKLLGLITARGPMTRQQIWRSLNDPKAATFNAAMSVLIDRGDVVLENKLYSARI